jgi:hypothetical protein
MLMDIGTMPMTRTRVDDDGNVTTAEIRADDHGNGKLYLKVDADIEVGDIVEYKVPNGKPRTMRIVKHDVMQAPGGMRMGADLDHTVCEYEVVSAKPSQQPKRVNVPGMLTRFLRPAARNSRMVITTTQCSTPSRRSRTA